VVSLKTMAVMLVCKEVSCFDNLQIGFSVIIAKLLPTKRIFDCCCNMGHFLCGGERVKQACTNQKARRTKIININLPRATKIFHFDVEISL